MSKLAAINVQLKNGKTVEIREAVKKDAEALIVAAKSYLRTSEYLSYYEREFDPSKKEKVSWIESHDVPNSLLLIATYGKEIVATLNVVGFQNYKMRHVATLGISISHEFRGVGLGNELFKTMIDWAENNSKLEILTLEVFSENKPAISLYEKFGFIKEGQRRNYFKDRSGKYFDNIIMSLHLEKEQIINKNI